MTQTAVPLLPPMRIQILRLRGELGLEQIGSVSGMLGAYLKAGLVNVLLDLTHVDHIEQAVLPALNVRAVRLREYGGDLKLVGASPYIRNLLDLAGVSKSFDWCTSEDEAAQRFGQVAR